MHCVLEAALLVDHSRAKLTPQARKNVDKHLNWTAQIMQKGPSEDPADTEDASGHSSTVHKLLQNKVPYGLYYVAPHSKTQDQRGFADLRASMPVPSLLD